MSRAETFGVCRLLVGLIVTLPFTDIVSASGWMLVGIALIEKCFLSRGFLENAKTDNMDKESLPESIIMGPDTTYSPLFWEEDGVAIGDYDSFFIGDEEYSTSSLIGLKEWFLKADKYDPYTDIAQFTIEGMEEWINQGYEYAKQLRSIIPNSVKIYYGYWHQFGDGHWRWCKAYIAQEQ